jgi:hypothetical protein
LFSARLLTSRLATAVALVCFTSTLAMAGSITVTPTITAMAGIFHYDYSIANTTPNDVFLIDIPVPPSATAIQNLTAPAGFVSAFDSGLGLVSFLENTSLFGSIPMGGFAFDSALAPGMATFQASFVNSTGGIETFSGATMAPVPEPGSMGLLAMSMLALMLGRRHRRNNAQIAASK